MEVDPLSNRAPSSILGSGLFTGFTRLCKGLSVILVSGYILLQIFPSAATYLALIPARTIPFAWNLITAGYIEQTLPGVIISIIGLLFFGKLLEPLWGPKEFLKFVIVVNFLTSICVFTTAIGLYYIRTEEAYLYTPLSGFHGVVAGFLVGIKQIIPDQELVGIKAKWLPTIIGFVSSAISFFIEGSATYIPTIIFGIYTSWIYLRYFQKKPESGLKGDPSDEFSFSSFFPEFMRPILDPVASIFDRVLCGRTRNSGESADGSLDASHLPGSDPIEAMRRRERGARALEQRLAAEKLNAKGNTEDAASENV